MSHDEVTAYIFDIIDTNFTERLAERLHHDDLADDELFLFGTNRRAPRKQYRAMGLSPAHAGIRNYVKKVWG